MNRFNLKVFKKFWSLAKLYWWGNEKKGAISLLSLLFTLLIAYTLLSALLVEQQGNMISALSNKDASRFWNTIKILLGIVAIYIPLFASYGYVRGLLGNYWRKSLTHYITNRYLNNRSFYKLGNFNKDIDNPDQRIAEDIKGFTIDSLSFLLSLALAIFQVAVFSVKLWEISSNLVYLLIVYSFIGTLVIVGVFGKKLVKINFDQIKKEADFRFGLVRIRENSESIAFYQGENQENKTIRSKFTEVFRNFNLLIIWQEMYLGLFTNAYDLFPAFLPAIIIAPSVLSGDLEVGKVTVALSFFARVFGSLNLIVSRFQSLTAFAASVDRLFDFEQYLADPKITLDKNILECPTIDTFKQDTIALKKVTLQTPNYTRTLVKNLSIDLATGQGLLIMGASGCGKSSLLRAIAGLWNSGTGAIYRPDLSQMLFLPQKPYMILGTLRNQLAYPNDDLDVSDSAIEHALKAVNLPNVVEQSGGLDIEKDWDDVLSLGEQQRLAFARIIINKPQYVILDEATSALDIQNEASLYQHLVRNKITYVSVGHRPSLVDYHNYVLEIKQEAGWELTNSNEFR